MRTVIIIPARYKSTRFPGKPLTKILDKPLIIWVLELCALAIDKNDIYVATDDKRIKNEVESAGYQSVMTSENALTGTDRVAEAAQTIKADIYVNVQGDEPLVNPADILKIRDEKINNPECVIKGYTELLPEEKPDNRNIPKVIFNENSNMLYMSRQAIPGTKDGELRVQNYYKAVCIYAFNRKDLISYQKFGRKSVLEEIEDIEILRFLDIGTTVKMVKTSASSIAVDVPNDVKLVEKIMLENLGNRY